METPFMFSQDKLQKLESYKRLINLGLVLLCLLLETAVFAYQWYGSFRMGIVEGRSQPFYIKGHLLEIAVYFVILVMFSRMYGGTRLGYVRNAELIFSQIFATGMADALIYAEISLMAHRLFPPQGFFIMLGAQAAIVFVYTKIATFFYCKIFSLRKLLFVYGDRDPEAIKAKFATRQDRYAIVEQIHASVGTDAICDMIDRLYAQGECNSVLLGDIPDGDRTPLLKFCYGKSIRVYQLPKITDIIAKGAEILHVFDSPLLLTREYSLTMEQRFVKRAIDIVCSLILIVVTTPFMLLTALAVKFYDYGPVLYRQVRVTRGGKEFSILKFRSMRVDAEKDGARLSCVGDTRVTPIGAFIRKVRLDELPQLFNILVGDMSFIGPRPERPEIIAKYQEQMPEFAYRLKVKAGLGGFAQVYGKYNTTPYDKLKLDLIYIENYSLFLDLRLMLLTLKVLFWPDSTQGVAPGQTTAMLTRVAGSNKEGIAGHAGDAKEGKSAENSNVGHVDGRPPLP